MTEIRPYPATTCFACAKAAGGKLPVNSHPAWWQGECGRCGKVGSVTDPKAFGNPHFVGHEL